MDLYAETILDHARRPRGKEPLPRPTVTHEEMNVACGDRLTVELMLEGDRIRAAGWSGDGCAISQAGMSLLWETLKDKTLEDIDALSKESVLALLGVPIGTRRMKCALLCLHTVKNAVRRNRGKEMQGWRETMQETMQ